MAHYNFSWDTDLSLLRSLSMLQLCTFPFMHVYVQNVPEDQLSIHSYVTGADKGICRCSGLTNASWKHWTQEQHREKCKRVFCDVVFKSRLLMSVITCLNQIYVFNSMRPIDRKYFVQEHAMIKYFKMGDQWVGMGWEATFWRALCGQK